jgi:peptide/nickel transport system permease protein
MTVLGPAMVGVLGGAVVTETIFAWPGMGRLTINAVFQQDYPLVLGAGMFFAVLTIIGYLLSDIFLRPGRSTGAARIVRRLGETRQRWQKS